MPGIDGTGGAERSFVETAALLLDSGVQLHLAILNDRKGMVPTIEMTGVVVHDLSTAASLRQRVAALRRLVNRLQPDLVHATLFEATLPCQLALMGGRVPLLVTWASTNHSNRVVTQAGAAAWKLRCVRTAERIAGSVSRSRYHAVTAGVARVNGEAMGIDPSRIFIGERGRHVPGTAGADQVVQSDGSLRTEFRLGDSQKVVLMLGRQEPSKGQADLIRCFDLVHGRTGAALIIAGDEGGASRANQEARADLSHPGAIHIVGHRDDVAELLGLADVLAIASTVEGACGAAIEAMAARVPIVSTRLEGLEGILEDESTALVVDRDNLSRAIADLLEDAGLRARLSTKAYELFGERFTVERSAATLRGIYESVVREGANPQRHGRCAAGGRTSAG